MSKHKLRDEAKDRACQICLPGICNRNAETTVLAHLNSRRVFRCGMGQKVPDEYGAHSCSDCHDAVDHRVKTDEYTDEELLIAHMEGAFRTQLILRDEGKL